MMHYEIRGMWNEKMLDKAKYPIEDIDMFLIKPDIKSAFSVCTKCGYVNYIHPKLGQLELKNE